MGARSLLCWGIEPWVSQSSVVFKRFAVETLMQAIEAVVRGEVWMPASLQKHLAANLRDLPPVVLTAREREITHPTKGGNQSDFGDPTSTASYAVCIYAGTTSALVIDALVQPGGDCDGDPCWKPIADKGYGFKDKLVAAQGGISKIQLKGSTSATSKILVKGSGDGLHLTASTLPLPEDAPVSVRVHNSDNGNCWGADFAAPFKKNTDGGFKAKTP